MLKLLIKHYQKETVLFYQRCYTLGGVIFIILICIVSRLFYLQVIRHHFYQTLSQHNLVQLIPLAPKRGLIYDRNGLLLAKNLPSYILTITPNQTPHLQYTLQALKKFRLISEQDIQQLLQQKKQYRPFSAIPLKLKLTEQQVDQYEVNRYRFPGVRIQASNIRYYPLKQTMSEVTGYIGRINAMDKAHIDPINYMGTHFIGKMGVEKQFEPLLHGTVGHEEVETSAIGRIVRTLKRTLPVAGDNIYLTIDSRLQKVAYHAMGDRTGAIVVVQPSNGQILAMVSHPSYNPNVFVHGMSTKAYQALLKSPKDPLINRAIRGQFAPGSTIKPFYAIEGLETKTITPNDKIFDPGWFRLPHTHHIYHDWQPQGHGWVNYAKAIMVSSDTFFYHLAAQLGIKRLDQILSQFGFGRRTHIALPSELPGILPSIHWKIATQGKPWYTGDTVNMGIGQGYLLVTPLQLAMAIATIAEHGLRFRPQLILKIQKPNQKPQFKASQPQSPIQLKHPVVWNEVISAMASVITNPHGTGLHFGRHPSYTVAAKTGTAQIYGHSRDEYALRIHTDLPKRLRNNALFISFAPIQKPQIALVVITEHDGSAPHIARTVMDAYFNEHPIHG